MTRSMSDDKPVNVPNANVDLYGYANPQYSPVVANAYCTVSPVAEGNYTQAIYTRPDENAAELARYKRLYDLELARAVRAEGELMALTWAQVNCDEMRRQLTLVMEKARSILCSSQFDELDEYLEQLGGIDGAAKTSA